MAARLKDAVISLKLANAELEEKLEACAAELAEAYESQTATSDVLKLISRSTVDLQPVLARVAETAARLCQAEMAFISRRDGNVFRYVTSVGSTAQAMADAVRFQRDFLDSHPISGLPGRRTMTGRVILERRAVQIVDITADAEYEFPETFKLAKIRTLLGVPLLRAGELIGVMNLARQRVEPFTERQIALVSTFADQAVIAIENARLLAEQREALEQQTATAEVLEAINSSPGDLAPVFEAMLDKALAICGAAFGILWTYDGNQIHAAAVRGLPPAMAEFVTRAPHEIGAKNAHGRLLGGEPVVHIADVRDDEAYRTGDPIRRNLVDVGGGRTLLAVPLRKDGIFLGDFVIYRREVKLFSEKQIALLQSFAAQAVIAMENARLLTGQREALEQQTATAEILKVINRSPGDLAPVFETILLKAHSLCGVSCGSLQLYDGEKFRAVAVHGLSQALADELRRAYRPGPNLPHWRLVDGARFAHLHDIAEIDDPIARVAAERSGIRTTLFIPLRKDGALLGQIVAARHEVKPFTEKDIALLESFAAQAVIAMENARLLTEQRAALEQQTAVGDVLKVISRSTFDLQGVLDTLVATAARLCDTDMAFILRRDGEVFRAGADVGFTPEFEEFLRAHPIAIDRGSTTGRVALEKRIVHILDTAADPEYRLTEATTLSGQRTTLGVPLLRDGEVIGVIVLARRRVEPFSDKHIELVTTFADQAVIAIENARLMTETREALEQQTATADVLGVINSSPGDLTPVFAAILEKAMQLCDVAFGILRIYDGARFHTAAARGVPPAYAEFLAQNPQAPQAGTIGARILGGETLVHVVDAKDDEVYRSGETHRRALVDLGRARTSLVVPLTTDRGVVGAIQFYRQEVRPFTEKQIALLQNFAAQAVIAMENARLMTETREALEQQTATAEVLGVINSSPGDLAPVFDAVLEKALRLCEAASGLMWTFNGERAYVGASRDVPDAFLDYLRREPPAAGPDTFFGRAILTHSIIHSADIAAEEPYHRGVSLPVAAVELGGIRAALFVPLIKDGTVPGIFSIFRKEVGPFSEKQIALLQNFATQAVIAMENARLMTETREALEQQTATAEILQVINSSPGNLAPVFDAMVERAMRLCGATIGAVCIWQGDRLSWPAVRGPQRLIDYISKNEPWIGPRQGFARVAKAGGYVHNVDISKSKFYSAGNSHTRALVDLFGVRATLVVPLARDDEVLGLLTFNREEPRAYSEREIALVRNFAAQAVIAMENARLMTETREALEQQTATAEVLRVISGSATDVQPVFDAIVARAAKLCEAELSWVTRFDYELLHIVALNNLAPYEADALRSLFPRPPTRGFVMGRAFVEGRTVHVEDVLADPEYDPRIHEFAHLTAYRTFLGVPIVRDGKPIGVIGCGRRAVRPFSPAQIELVTTFADQAVIAIENARLFGELRDRSADLARSVDELTATGDVLKIISRSTVDLEMVLDTLVETVARLCHADEAYMFRRRGDLHHLVASCGVSDEWKQFIIDHPFVPGRGTTSGRVALERRVVHIPDVLEDPEYTYNEGQKAAAYRTMLGIPLLREEALVGVFVVTRTRVAPFTDKEIGLVTSFADQAVIAIENARLFEELRERQAELRVTFDNMGDGVAMFDAGTRLAAWNRNYQHIIDLPDDFLAARPTFAEVFRYLTARGEYGSADLVAELSRSVEDTTRELRFERTRPDGRVIEARRSPVPDGGFVMIYSDITERKRAEAEIRAARDTAEAALADLKAAQASLIQAEKMASLGQLTAGIAHEIKNPLNFVNNFAGLSIDLVDELKETADTGIAGLDAARRAEIDETMTLLRGNLEKIAQHGKRADGIVRSMLEHSRGGTGERRKADLNQLIEEALNLAYHGARAQDQSFNITLQTDLDPALGPIDVAPQDIMRVFLNLCSNGFYAARKRQREWGEANFQPTLKVTTRDLGNVVEVRVRDNGIGIPPEIKDKLFQPFFTTKPTGEGTGLGLSISYDIVTQQHGGTIGIESAPREFTEFTVRLPRAARPKPGATGP